MYILNLLVLLYLDLVGLVTFILYLFYLFIFILVNNNNPSPFDGRIIISKLPNLIHTVYVATVNSPKTCNNYFPFVAFLHGFSCCKYIFLREFTLSGSIPLSMTGTQSPPCSRRPNDTSSVTDEGQTCAMAYLNVGVTDRCINHKAVNTQKTLEL